MQILRVSAYFFENYMHIFDYLFLDAKLSPSEIVNLTSTVFVFNSLSKKHEEQYIGVYSELKKIARVQSVKTSNASNNGRTYKRNS